MTIVYIIISMAKTLILSLFYIYAIYRLRVSPEYKLE